MPIYEYACAKCGETIEAIQKFSDPPLKKHRDCGGILSKLVSAPTFRVKENDGLTGSTHSSILQDDDNRKIAKDKKKKRAAVISMPSLAKAGAGASRGKSKSK